MFTRLAKKASEALIESRETVFKSVNELERYIENNL